jgi:flagellin-specific chaperone FliS
MDTVNQREKELQRLSNILRRIGKALDEDDTSKLAAMVEALVRKVK